MAERVGFVPAVPAPINDLGLIRSSQITKFTQNLSIRYKTGTVKKVVARRSVRATTPDNILPQTRDAADRLGVRRADDELTYFI